MSVVIEENFSLLIHHGAAPRCKVLDDVTKIAMRRVARDACVVIVSRDPMGIASAAKWLSLWIHHYPDRPP